jgi:carbon monoxide dehydrogenase subunit G
VAAFQLVREVRLDPQDAWNRVTDWQRHGQFVPLTRITITPDGFDAFTGLGPLGFHDPMQIVEVRAPQLCRLVKRGRVVTGWAELAIEPLAGGSRVIWREDIHVRGLPAFLDEMTRLASQRLFGRVLDGLLA